MKNVESKTYRMYGLVPYNISPIQQGIQYGHAVVEYLNKYFNEPDCTKWRLNDKTFVILNGGTTNKSFSDFGTLNKYQQTLDFAGVRTASFYEPDLGNQLTAVVFLVDERVYDKTLWPDYNGMYHLNGTPIETDYYSWKMKFAETEEEANQVVVLRDFIKQFRLA